MPENTQSAPPILDEAEVDRRMLLLAELQAALAARQVRSVLARRHRLVLTSNGSPRKPSGMTDPELRIFTPDGIVVATTDGTTYRLAGGTEHPVTDPAATAAAIAATSSTRGTEPDPGGQPA